MAPKIRMQILTGAAAGGLGVVVCCALSSPQLALGEEDLQPEANLEIGDCTPSTPEEIPFANEASPLETLEPPLQEPVEVWRITQVYNGAGGHNGLDLSAYSESVKEGIDERDENIFSSLDGKVIKTYEDESDWGRSVLVVSRLNPNSDELVTLSYHHLHERYVAPCDSISAGDLIGLEGDTGDSDGAHLHLTVRYWANLDHLTRWMNSGTSVFGPGYVGKNVSALQGKRGPNDAYDASSPFADYGHLDPDPFLRDLFWDYESSPDYAWSEIYAKKMRRYGINLGKWNGDFGSGDPVKRREAARWLRIAIGDSVELDISVENSFVDVEEGDPDARYISELTMFPSPSVIDPKRICTGDQVSFCPNQEINRAEALKMVVLSFYSDEFQEFWGENFWEMYATPELVADAIGVTESDLFSDVDLLEHWFAPYVYFGVSRGIVSLQDQFYPSKSVVRAEMAKWVVLGYEEVNGSSSSPCDGVECPEDQYCDESTLSCVPAAECVPTESDPCEVGGGAESFCGDGQCGGGETCDTCGLDCGPCVPECGDGDCTGFENCGTCTQDCGVCPVDCPDDVCGADESCESCPQDCGFCQPECGDSQCNGTETCATCPGDCGICEQCGDNQCSGNETCASCPGDCGVCEQCGDNLCGGSEDCQGCPQDCGYCVCAENEIDEQSCDPGTYCPLGTQQRVCSNDSWGPWGSCESDLGLKYHGDGGEHCGPVACLQISASGSDSTLTATISKADNGVFDNDVNLFVFQPFSNDLAQYGCVPTQGQTSYQFQLYPDSFTLSLGGTMWVNAQLASPCVNGAYYISEDAAVSQCSSN